ncbi:hypothetical protein B9Z55_007248 [Caenorhabditis nigoni]|uniref:C-type lectin domain-containing protein n=1 Tax=Caenorhabditis nigoni TaxID=1611254 RepID=A0A2G5V8U2_9PELO|nr:hypothetical protein B9Z55_007248 [Caenorhabditis nigoni]
MLRHLPILLILVTPGYCMFRPQSPKQHCVDPKAYFAVDENQSRQSYNEENDEFFHVEENLEVSQNQRIQNDMVQRDTLEESNGNCQAGWKSFKRPSGEWCMKIFYEDSITQSTAEQRCQAQGATLSGLQNHLESLYVTYTVSTHIYPSTGSIWVGLKRRKSCEKVGLTRDCTWATSFLWTDNSATGTDGLAWACNQPDNARNRSQSCATLTASYKGSVLGFQTGLLDDVGCDFDYIKMDRKDRDIKAYICGKKPKV